MKEQIDESALKLFTAQMEAQASGRGLWRDATPVAPWDFRNPTNGH